MTNVHVDVRRQENIILSHMRREKCSNNETDLHDIFFPKSLPVYTECPVIRIYPLAVKKDLPETGFFRFT